MHTFLVLENCWGWREICVGELDKSDGKIERVSGEKGKENE